MSSSYTPYCPVLKHGPRSLTLLRVRGLPGLWAEWKWGILVLQESEVYHNLRNMNFHSSVAPNTGNRSVDENVVLNSLVRCRNLSESNTVGTRKMVIYAWTGRSQGKPWWRLVAILTCKSFVILEYRGERLIEPSSSWFPLKFPSG